MRVLWPEQTSFPQHCASVQLEQSTESACVTSPARMFMLRHVLSPPPRQETATDPTEDAPAYTSSW